MSTSTTSESDEPEVTTDDSPGDRAALASKVRRHLGLRWWKELIYVVVFYEVYSFVRNRFGSNGTTGLAVQHALDHARDVIHIERTVGLWIEPHLQRWYLDLPSHGFIRFWNIYYGTAHFLVTIGVLIVLYRRDPGRYPTWRNALAIMTAAALIGFASFSLMPPRLLNDTSAYGACAHQAPTCTEFRFVDTLERYGGLWSFDSGAMAKVSNQYAAMPSLHTGWSTWCAFALFPLLRRRWAKVLLALYPVFTVFCIMITGNHYWLDALGGLGAFAIGYGLGAPLARATRRRHERRLAAAVAAGTAVDPLS